MSVSAAPPPGRAQPNGDDIWVVCLCAEWCGVCREYRAVMDQIGTDYPRARLVWVDVEDDEGLAGDIDIDTFPTVLLGQGEVARFFGPLLPQAGVLKRLLESVQAQGDTVAEVRAQALLARIIAARS